MNQARLLSISKPLLQVTRGVARLSVIVRCPEGTAELWFSLPAAHADKLSAETCDGFVVGLYAAAAQRGLDVHVEGAMSARLLQSLNGQAGELLYTLLPYPRKVRVLAAETCAEDWGGREVFTGFSAGVDSFCTLFSHTRADLPREQRLSGLFYNNVGSHGHDHAAASLYRMRERRVRAIAAQVGLPLIDVSSNLDALLRVPFRRTHTLRNLAVALLFQRACGAFLYASTVHFRDVAARNVQNMGYADPILLPLLRTETLTGYSAGSEYTRHDKTRLVARHALTYNTLDVCVSQSPSATINCSVCWKCLRTQLSLELLGCLEDYREVFQIERYRRVRPLFLASVLQSRDALLLELREQLMRKPCTVPRLSRALRWLAPPEMLRRLVQTYAAACSREDAAGFDLLSDQSATTHPSSQPQAVRAAVG